MKPILVGQKVLLNAKIVHTGKTSMHIFISVQAGDPKELELQETCTCIISFVAIDEDGNSVNVDQWDPVTEEDKLKEQFAIHAKEFSQRLQSEL